MVDGAEGEGRPSRRNLLAGAAGGLVVLAAQTLANAPGARAANGSAVKLGQANTETKTCTITNTAAGGQAVQLNASSQGARADIDASGDQFSNGLLGVNAGAGQGVRGDSTSGGGIGVYGVNAGAGPGVRGDSSSGSGVEGFNTDNAAGHGVHGSGATGVRGDGVLYGVYATTTAPSGTGLWADQLGGATALKVTGRASFSTAGVATVPKNQSSVVVPVATATGASVVLATVQQTAGGAYVKSAVPGAGQITIHLNTAPSVAVNVAYFVLG